MSMGFKFSNETLMLGKDSGISPIQDSRYSLYGGKIAQNLLKYYWL
jgi:hypothetical protein